MQELVTNEELESFPRAPFPEQTLSSVCGMVRDIVGWHVAPVIEETVLVRSRSSRVLILPTLKVVEVTRVEDALTGREVTGFINWGDGTLEADRPFPKACKVTMRHGYESCPPALLVPIVDEVSAIKAGGRVRSESLASRSVTLEVSGSSLTGPLAGPVLARYTIRPRP